MTIHYSDQLTILQQALVWLKDGQPVILATVANTWGSSPRPPGSIMVIHPKGPHLGSVSGGCVEEDLLHRYQHGELTSFPTRIHYGTNSAEAERFGLPCGGQLELVVEELQEPKQLIALLDQIKQGTLVIRRLCLETGQSSLHPADAYAKFQWDGKVLQQVFGPDWQLLLIGAGDLSRYVAQIALLLDYRVIICDPRKVYAANWMLKGTKLITEMPDDAVRTLVAHPRGLLCTLTHDPKLDDMALWEALQSPTFFIGALGSQRTNQKRRARLRQLGLSEAQIQRMHGPVGIPIGSHAPGEIAVSIMAAITAARNGIPYKNP